MLPLEQALERMLAAIRPLPVETVALESAAGRVLAEALRAPIDLPPYDNSAMDGYAVRWEDTVQASEEHPVALTLAGRLPAGETAAGALGPGQCVRVFTGSMLPPESDAVVMQEATRPDLDHAERVLVLEAVRPLENIRIRGTDVKAGSRIVGAGERLDIGNLALLGAMGLAKVPVSRRPTVGLMATGSELTEPGQALRPGRVYESNRVVLACLAQRVGAASEMFALVPDTSEATESALRSALDRCDVLVSSGGVSVGEMDLVKESFEKLGGRLEFWKVAMKPGKPFVYGRWRDKYWFGLPGNPVSALVTFQLLVRPALLRLQGCNRIGLPIVPGILAEPLRNRGDRRHFIRVRWEEDGAVRSAGIQASHMLHSMAAANGLVDVPPHSHLEAGAAVKVLLFQE